MNKKIMRLYITNRCDSFCKYCYRHSRHKIDNKSYNDLDLQSVLKFLGNYNKNIQSVKISGGEPSFYPDLNELIDKLKKLDIYIDIISNGALFNLDHSLLKSVDRFTLSFDSSSSPINNTIRGNGNATGNFIKSIKLLNSLDINNLIVQITLTKMNIDTLESTLDFLVFQLKVKKIKVVNIVEKRFGNLKKLRLTNSELKRANQIIINFRRKKRYSCIIETNFVNKKKFVFLHNNLSGFTSYCINQNNDLYFFIGEKNFFHIGNIKNEDPAALVKRIECKMSFVNKYLGYIFSEIKKSSLEFINPDEFIFNDDLITAFKRANERKRI